MLLVALAFCAATLGTMIGVGGGFIFVPVLLMLYPTEPYVWVVGLSMWLVALNASSGSIAYYFKGKVHLRAGLVFTLAALPGSVVGVWLERFVSRPQFELIFGLAMLCYSVFLLRKKPKPAGGEGFHPAVKLERALYLKGAAISFFVGFMASFLGIGGGVIHVPLLVHLLDFPVHMAAGTSHFILAITALFTTAAHIWRGDIDLHSPEIWQVGAAAVVGAQVGAALNKRVSGQFILRLLAIALLLVGIRLVVNSLGHLGLTTGP